MEQIDTIVIGAGQAGLATGNHLGRHGIPFVILEACRSGEIGEARVLGFALSIGTWDFEARGPEAAFVRFAPMNDGGELFHGDWLLCRSRFAKEVFTHSFSLIRGSLHASMMSATKLPMIKSAVAITTESTTSIESFAV